MSYLEDGKLADLPPITMPRFVDDTASLVDAKAKEMGVALHPIQKMRIVEDVHAYCQQKIDHGRAPSPQEFHDAIRREIWQLTPVGRNVTEGIKQRQAAAAQVAAKQAADAAAKAAARIENEKQAFLASARKAWPGNHADFDKRADALWADECERRTIEKVTNTQATTARVAGAYRGAI